jgi:hypothetical protein
MKNLDWASGLKLEYYMFGTPRHRQIFAHAWGKD